jgi:hypothetical protein
MQYWLTKIQAKIKYCKIFSSRSYHEIDILDPTMVGEVNFEEDPSISCSSIMDEDDENGIPSMNPMIIQWTLPPCQSLPQGVARGLRG